MNTRIVRRVLLLFVCLAGAGCRHKPQIAAAPPLPPAAPVPLVPAPEPATPRQVQPVPVQPVPLPKKPVQPKVKKPKKAVPVPSTAAAVAPVQSASAGTTPAESVIGALTAGGDADPAEVRKASFAISQVEKRLDGLPAATLTSQKEGVARVRSFLKQAHSALKSGDTDGAMTLATKAKLILEDLLNF